MRDLDINGSFERSWTTLPPYPGTSLLNQQPQQWLLNVVPPGEPLFDSADLATGYPECVHKLGRQLPPDEQLGGENALILDGGAVYKIFNSGAAFGAMLTQPLIGLPPGVQTRFIVPIQVHNHGNAGDVYAFEVWVGSANRGKWFNASILKDHEYVHLVVEGPAEQGIHVLQIAVKSKWDAPIDFFIDDVRFEIDDGVEPDDPCMCETILARLLDLENRLDNLEVQERVALDKTFEGSLTLGVVGRR